MLKLFGNFYQPVKRAPAAEEKRSVIFHRDAESTIHMPVEYSVGPTLVLFVLMKNNNLQVYINY